MASCFLKQIWFFLGQEYGRKHLKETWVPPPMLDRPPSHSLQRGTRQTSEQHINLQIKIMATRRLTKMTRLTVRAARCIRCWSMLSLCVDQDDTPYCTAARCIQCCQPLSLCAAREREGVHESGRERERVARSAQFWNCYEN